MEKIVCENCGWENPSDIRCCEKCHKIINDKIVLSITEVHPNKSGYGWNWCAFIFGGIWGLLHKLYWPFAIQVAPVIIFSFFILSGDNNIDPIMEEQAPPSALDCAIGSTFCILLILSPIINVFLGCRGNAWLHEKCLFKQYDKRMLLNKKLNWLALCSGGVSFLLVRSKKWLGIGTLISPILYLAGGIMVISGNNDIQNTAGYFLLLFSIITPIIIGLIGAVQLNKTIVTEEISDYKISKKYNWCRAVGFSWIIIIFWSVICMVGYTFG